MVYCVEEGPRALADAVFLLGAYLLLRMQVGAEEVPGHFRWLSASALRGACCEADCGATLAEGWRRLERGGGRREKSLWAGGAAARRGARGAFLPSAAVRRSRGC